MENMQKILLPHSPWRTQNKQYTQQKKAFNLRAFLF